jgi:hypothetical protein
VEKALLAERQKDLEERKRALAKEERQFEELKSRLDKLNAKQAEITLAK